MMSSGFPESGIALPVGPEPEVGCDPELAGAGPLDVAPLDAGPLEAEPLDAGPLDAGPLDAPPLVAGPPAGLELDTATGGVDVDALPEGELEDPHAASSSDPTAPRAISRSFVGTIHLFQSDDDACHSCHLRRK
jgi:hypothetical protein